MSEQPTACPKCGAPLPAKSIEGLCPKCLAAVSFAPDSTGTVRSATGALTPLSEKPGDRIGRYKLLQKIGEGGCGVVYMAEQEEPIRRRVAVKVIKLGMDTRQVIARFEAERQALAMMDHPNIAKVLDAGSTEAPVAAGILPAVEPGVPPCGEGARNSTCSGSSTSEPGGKMPPAPAGGTPAATLSADRPYFVMELVKGIRITDYCDQNNLPTTARLDLFIKVCSAIQHAHQKGIIHRDIKPSNVLVTLHDGMPVPKVIDFGIAKATEGRLTDKTLFTAFEQFIGTPAYMSPEQAEMSGLDIDTRSDIYSLGVLLYELLTGKTPFDAKELIALGLGEMRRQIRETEPRKPSTRVTLEMTAVAAPRESAADPPGEASGVLTRRKHLKELIDLLRGDLDWIVMKCLEKDRTRRYETANGVATDIQRHLNNEPIVARPPSVAYRFQKAYRRNKLAFAAAAAVACALVLGVVASRWQAVRATRAERAQLRLGQQAQANETKARSEATKSRQVAQFLQEMLQGVGPSVALGRDTTMLKEILDKTAERIGKDLQGQPEVEAELRTTLGLVYHELRDIGKAAAMDRQALAVRTTLFGNEHKDVAASFYNLATVLGHYRSRAAEVETMARGALEINRKLLGPENLEVAKCLAFLGAIVADQGYAVATEEVTLPVTVTNPRKLAEGEAMERQALVIWRKLLGNDHKEVAESLSDLSIHLMAKGGLAEAEATAREALAISRRLSADKYPALDRALAALAIVLRCQGKLAEAETIEREALAIEQRLFTADHWAVVQLRGRLADLLRAQGKVGEAESILREQLANARKTGGSAPEKLVHPLTVLVDFLLTQHRYSEAEQIFSDVLTPEVMSQPQSAGLLSARGNFRARTGRWKEAAADFSKAIELEPEEHWTYFVLAPLLVESGNLEAYHRHCAQIRIRFGGTTNDPGIAERMAIACLILPSHGADLITASGLADVAVTGGKGDDDEGHYQFCKALAEYRQEHFAGALEWTQKVLARSEVDSLKHDVAVYMVQAMALYRLQRISDARTSLAKGVEIAETKLPKLERGPLDSGWFNWVIAQVLMREAKALIRVTPSAVNEQAAEKR